MGYVSIECKRIAASHLSFSVSDLRHGARAVFQNRWAVVAVALGPTFLSRCPHYTESALLCCRMLVSRGLVAPGSGPLARFVESTTAANGLQFCLRLRNTGHTPTICYLFVSLGMLASKVAEARVIALGCVDG